MTTEYTPPGNPACPIMTANCPPGANCRLGVNSTCLAQTVDGPASRYEYECRSCGKKWLVDWLQQQPEFSRSGHILNPPQPIVTALD